MEASTAVVQQRETALLKANRHRQERAQLKRDLKTGQIAFEDLLLDPPECIRKAEIGEMLRHAPTMGTTKSARALLRSRINSATFGTISQAGRYSLLAYLDSHHPRALGRN